VGETRSEADGSDVTAVFDAEEDVNKNRRHAAMSLFEKAPNKLMLGFRPQKRENGDLPNAFFIPRKPEPLGAEFKSVCVQQKL
jgi:hypothetical protein